MRNSIWLLGAVLLSACGPSGVLSGKVTVEGGMAGSIPVIAYGPQSAATVTGTDGAFSIGNLPDGVYVVRATLRGADVEEISASTTITQGKASPEPVLAFRASTAKVTGRVVMADGSGPENLTVTATGPEIRGARTAADGSFTFDGLKTGAYVVGVEARDTREGRVAVGVNASGSADVGELRLTPVGRLSGAVLYNTMPVAGAPVVVTGTNVSTVTDAMGRFSLNDVPTGMQAVRARVGAEPFFRSATAMVTVARGANSDLMLSLTDDAPRTGTVTGTVTFHGPRTPRDITINVPGSGVTATPQANGAFSLALPVGAWDVIANAAQHPPKLLGRVTVLEGQTQALPGAEVGWYRPVWNSSTTINSSVQNVTAGTQNDNVPWSLVTFTDTTSRLALINSTTYDFRILAAGTTSGQRISKSGKYAGWFVNSGAGGGTVFVYEIGTATLSTFTTLTTPVQSVNRIEFSSDETAIFIQRVGPASLTRIKFASANNPETFPPGGAASTGIFLTTVDRWFVRDASNAIRLVTPLIDVASVFTNVSTFSATPTAWAFTNCTLNCDLYVLSPTSTSPALRDSSATLPAGTYANFTGYGYDNRADYPCFSNGTNAFCVKSSDSTHLPLTNHPTSFRLNEAGDRVIWTFASGANSAVREEVMPPTGTSNLGSNTVGWQTGWLSPTRAYALESSGGPRALHLVKGGVPTLDNDVGSQAASIAPPLIVFPQSSTSQWRAYLGDGTIRSIQVPTNVPVYGVSVRFLGTGPTAVTKYAAISFDTVNSYIVDETAGAVRPTSVGASSAGTFSGGYRSGATEYFDMQRPGSAYAFFVFNTSVLLEYNQSNINLQTTVGAAGVGAWLGLDENRRTIVHGGFLP